MGVTICLKLDGFDKLGESQVAGHKDGKWMDVLSWNWGLTQSASAHVSTGASSGSADVKDLTITKYLDKASPNLIKNCFIGANHKDAVLEVLKATGKGSDSICMVRITMAGPVFISSVHTGEHGDNDRFVETVSFNFATVKFEYTGQKADQSADAPVSSGDLKISEKF
jgi:type VI secretion system secreted protein Hcp